MYIRLARVYHMYINQTIYTHIKTLPYYVNRKLTSADSWLWNPSHDQGKKKKITSANTTKIIILTIWGNSYMMTGLTSQLRSALTSDLRSSLNWPADQIIGISNILGLLKGVSGRDLVWTC